MTDHEKNPDKMSERELRNEVKELRMEKPTPNEMTFSTEPEFVETNFHTQC